MSNPKTEADAGKPAAGELSEVEFELSLEDTMAQHQRGLAAKSTTGRSGYNPYDTSVAQSADERARSEQDSKRKPKDLRKLSEWIRLQRQVEALKKDPPDSE